MHDSRLCHELKCSPSSHSDEEAEAAEAGHSEPQSCAVRALPLPSGHPLCPRTPISTGAMTPTHVEGGSACDGPRGKPGRALRKEQWRYTAAWH